MKPRVMAILIVALSGIACVGSKVPDEYCASVPDFQAASVKIDPDRFLMVPAIPQALREAVLTYLWGEICGQPVCTLFPNPKDIKACEEGYSIGDASPGARLVIYEAKMVPGSSFAVIGVVTTKTGTTLAMVFRKFDNGRWLVFEPLSEGGIGVP